MATPEQANAAAAPPPPPANPERPPLTVRARLFGQTTPLRPPALRRTDSQPRIPLYTVLEARARKRG